MRDDAIYAKVREGDDVATIPFVVHEMRMAEERKIRNRLTWAAIGAVVLLILSNAAWIMLR